MDKIKRFIDCYIPTETCNLRCHYCYITQKRRFNAKLASFTHTPEEIKQAFSMRRWGGPCLINMCAGGETLLSEELLPIVKVLLEEGHYVMIVTNGTMTNRFEEISEWPAHLLKKLFFKFSYHFLELKRMGWTEKFFDNVQRIKQAGGSFTIEVTPSDELIPYIEELKSNCIKYSGAISHFTIARDDRTQGIDVLSNLSWDEYIKTWGVFNSPLFDFKTQIFQKKRSEFCYAGAWSYYLNLESGDLRQCYCGEKIWNIYEKTDRPIPEKPIGRTCSLPYCYNGHAFLALGDIPELESPTYADERNRICEDGSEWLQPEMKSFMATKMYESNRQYSMLKKARIRFKQWTVQRGIRNTKVYKIYHTLRGN